MEHQLFSALNAALSSDRQWCFVHRERTPCHLQSYPVRDATESHLSLLFWYAVHRSARVASAVCPTDHISAIKPYLGTLPIQKSGILPFPVSKHFTHLDISPVYHLTAPALTTQLLCLSLPFTRMRTFLGAVSPALDNVRWQILNWSLLNECMNNHRC